MTSARIQPFCRKCNIDIGSFDGTRISLRSITQRNTSLFIYNSHFCLIWKSNIISFNQVIEDELKPNFKDAIMLYPINMLKVLLYMNTNLNKSNLH